MRGALVEAMRAAGASPVVGGGDRALARPIPLPSGLPWSEDCCGPHVPDIVHSTVVRWASEPADRLGASRAFEEAAASWGDPVDVSVESAVAVFEDTPFMHIPQDGSRAWWQWNADAATS